MPEDIQETIEFLYGLRNRGSTYGLERMQVFASALGNPERTFPSIHVAGTNGKGSTCVMLEACLRANGLSTGMFTSPHLVRLGERVRIDGEELTETEIIRLVRHLRSVADGFSKPGLDDYPTFFEFLTAIAFLAFGQQEVDVAIFETGLGGRLDSTNILNPLVSVITSIGLDHCDLLGYDIESIANEKAGIIKTGKPVVLGWLPKPAEDTVRSIAVSRNASLYSVPDRMDVLPRTSLVGSFQRRNAAVALTVCELLEESFPIDSSKCKDALLKVQWPGRWQEIDFFGNTLILDATHNAEGVCALEENLRKLKLRPIVLAGTLGDERAADLMPAVARHASEIRLLEPSQPRACSFGVLRSAIPESFAGTVVDTTIEKEFPLQGWVKKRSQPTVVTGSIYLLGEVLGRIDSCGLKNNALGSLHDLP